MKRMLGPVYIFLLLLTVGCTIQQRTDGGFRIDLPPFFGRAAAPALEEATSTPVPTEEPAQQIITVVVTATPTELITATTPPGQTIPSTKPAKTTKPPAETIPGTTIPPIPATKKATATAGPTTSTPPAATAPSTGTSNPTVTIAPTSRSGSPSTATPSTPTSQPGTPTSSPSTGTPGTSTPGTPSTGTPPGSPSTSTPPAGTATGEPEPSATPAPDSIYVGSEQSYVEGSTLYVVGEVVNATGQPVYNVRVIGTFFEGTRIVAAGETLALLPASVPASINPFKLAIASVPSNLERYELSLVWDDISIATYERLRTMREELVEEDEGAQIIGEVGNNSGQAMRDVRVVATLYDESGAVINAFAGTPAETTLESGASTTYTVEIPAGVEFEGYLVQSQGMLAAQ